MYFVIITHILLLNNSISCYQKQRKNICTSERRAKKKSNSSLPKQSIKIDGPLTYNMQGSVVLRWKQPINGQKAFVFLTFDEEAFAELEKY